MGFSVFDLVAKITLNTVEYNKSLGEAEKNFSGLGEKISGIGKGIMDGLATAGKAVAIGIGAATTAVGGFAAASVKTGATFDTSMAQVAATMGKTVDEIQDLRDYALEMGSKTAFSASQAADALNYMALAGYDSEKSMQMLPNVLNLAAAGAMDLASASDMVTDAQSALGLNMDETSELVDKMAKASSKSNTSVSQLGSAILTVGGTAKGLAGGTTELAQVLGLLADNGIKGAEGGTALRNIILSLVAPTDKAALAMEKLGINVNDADGNMRPMKDIMTDLDSALSAMSQSEKTQVLDSIFNKVDLKSVNALLATNVERWDELSNAIDNASGSAEAMANTQLDNLEGDITLFKSALEGAQIVISDQLTPSLRDFVQLGTQGLTDISNAFQENGFTGAMEAFGTVLSEALNMVIEKLPEMINAGMQLLGALGQGIIDNLPVIIEAAVQIVQELMVGITSALPAVAEGAMQILGQLAQGLSELAPTIIPDAVNAILDTILALLDNADALVGGAVSLITGLTDGIINALPILIERLPEIITAIVEALILNAPQLTFVGPKIILALITGLLQALPELLALPIKIVGDLLAMFVADAPKLLAGGVEFVKQMIEGIGQMLPNLLLLGPSIITQFLDSIVREGIKLIDAGKEVGGNIAEGISGVIDDAINWGRDLIDNFASGILEKIDYVRGIISDLASAVADLIGFSEPSEGPLSKFHTFAPDMMRLFAKGIKDNERLVTNQIKDSFDFGNLIKTQDVDISLNPETVTYKRRESSQGSEGLDSVKEGFVQNLTFNSPQALDPSEIARQAKNAMRATVLQLRMG